MSKTSDRDRMLLVLSGGQQSNHRVRDSLGMSIERFTAVRDDLLSHGLVEKYQCRGGGTRLTKSGEAAVGKTEPQGTSNFAKETDIYDPLVATFEDEYDGDSTIAINTGSIRKRGEWQNPDVVEVTCSYHPTIRRHEVWITTYEVKRWNEWSVATAYEAAAQARCAHESYVVIEWLDDFNFMPYDPSRGLDQLMRECERFGVGLITITKHYTKFKYEYRLMPQYRNPFLADVEQFLSYALARRKDAATRFKKLMDAVPNQNTQTN